MLRALAVRVAARRGSIIAATAGASAATAAAAAYCDSAKAKTPPFVLDGDRYDQTTFAGRLAKIQELIDMRTLLTTDDELAAAQARLGEFKKLGRKPDGVSDEDMWEAQKTVNAIIHGPTGEKMFLFGRMSMFVPMNVPVAFGLLVSKSTAAVLFWQYAQRARTPETHEPETACRARTHGPAHRAPHPPPALRARAGGGTRRTTWSTTTSTARGRRSTLCHSRSRTRSRSPPRARSPLARAGCSRRCPACRRSARSCRTSP